MSSAAGAAQGALHDPELTGITRLSASDTVRARIALAVELDLIGAGERLPRDAEIAAALDVSEMTVRRALESMAEDGLVERRRGRNGGTFTTGRRDAVPDRAAEVYRQDASEVHRLIDVRTLLECAIVHHAALSATDDDIAAMESHVAAASAAGDWSAYHRADEQFHLAVAQAADLPWAVGPYREVLAELYTYFIPYPIERLHRANEDHAGIVEAIRRGDPIAAVERMRSHVQVLHRTMYVGGATDA
ncbi:FCD domain-containing protein [uncultured Microbacterium sp.]|uniref:FadR/GntR family transcriptional regulator n=1 Tax=uncultured Microbacterium sp. TaxID=191216 RepID=UPI00262A8E73|nr:FCD domain-containing protein [uncultured Microbacterium sp.]